MAETIPDPIERFRLDLVSQRRSVYTVRNYVGAVRRFSKWLQKGGYKRGPDEALPSQLKQYQVTLATSRLSKNTIYAAVKGLQAFYGFLDSKSGDHLRPPRRSQSLPTYLSEADAKTLRAVAPIGSRERAVISLLLYGGFRVSEVSRLEAADLDFHEQTVSVRHGKGDKDRLVVVAEDAMEDVRAWLATRQATASPFLFPARWGEGPIGTRVVETMVSRAARAAGIRKRVTPHVLRHTLATSLLRHGGDIRFIQRILGHASIATTQVYTHIDDGDLRRQYDRAKPEF